MANYVERQSGAFPQSHSETIEDTIFKYAQAVPKQLLSTNFEPTSVPVRSFLLALENLISQLKHRLPLTLEKYFISASYKFSAPHRHQIFWRYFRQLKSLVCKYNSPDLLKLLNDLHKKMTSSIAQSYYYMPTPETLRYIGAVYLHQLYTLEKLRESCIKTADTILGYLDIGHWQNLGLFILGLCSDVFKVVPIQAAEICSAYDSISEFIRTANSNFPVKSTDISLTAVLLEVNKTPCSDPQRVLKLLKLSESQMDDALLEDELNEARLHANKVFKNLEASLDLGIDIRRDNIDVIRPEFIGKICKKMKKKRNALPVAASTPILVKKKKRSQLNLSISSINSDHNDTPLPVKKKLKKIKKVELNVSVETSTTTSSTAAAKKKKKRKSLET